MYLDRSRTPKGCLLATSAALFICVAPAAKAQTETSAPATAAPTAASEDDIIVTAQRRSQNLREVPISITAISPTTVENLNIRTIDKIATVTPGLVLDTGYGQPQTYIRGIGTQIPTPGLESPIAVYVNGAYTPRGYGTLFDLLDIGSVQVLKGPQGTLYGHNASGGTILLTTNEPTHKFEGSGLFEYGRFNHVLGQAVVNVPVSDTFALRFAGQYKRDDGFVTNVATGHRLYGDDNYTLRGSAKFTPVGDLQAALTLEYSRTRGESLAASRNISPAPLCVSCSFGASQPSDFYQVSNDFEKPFKNRAFSANLRLQYDFDNVKVQSITAFRDAKSSASADTDQSSLPLFVFDDTNISGKTFSEDLQVSTSFRGWIDFLAGAQYIHDDAFNQGNLYGAAIGIPYPASNYPTTAQTVKTKSYAAYAEGYIKPFKKLTITLGGRYTEDERQISSNVNALALAIFNPGGPPAFSQRYSDKKFTPRVVMAYDFGRLNVYGSFTRGFKSGGFTTIAFAPQANSITPESVDSYEIGGKYVSHDRRFNINLSAFHYNFTNAQTTIIDVTTGGQIINNAAAERANGVELDFGYKVSEFLRLSSGGAYLDAKYTSYKNGLVYNILRDAMGAPLGYSAQRADLTGTVPPRAPKWSAYAAADFKAPVGASWTARLSGVIHYTSTYDFFPGAGGESHADRQPAFAIANLSGGIGPSSERYEIGFYIDNLTDKKISTLIATGGFGVSQIAGAPRTYGLRLKTKF